MTEKQNSLTEGQITIHLDGVERELIPSVEAITKLSRAYNGLANLLDRIRLWDLDAYTAVVRYGLQIPANEAKDLPEKVYEAGIFKLMPPLTEYVALLCRGGRAESEEAAGRDEGNG
jgi:hypothetical protein